MFPLTVVRKRSNELHFFRSPFINGNLRIPIHLFDKISSCHLQSYFFQTIVKKEVTFLRIISKRISDTSGHHWALGETRGDQGRPGETGGDWGRPRETGGDRGRAIFFMKLFFLPLGHCWATAGPPLGLKTFLGTWDCRHSKLIYQNNYS